MTLTVFFALFLSLICAAGAAAQVPTPTVTPMPAERPGTPERNYPFFATDIVLSNFGYVEQEFMFEGTANTYSQAAANGDVDVAQSNIPYRSRILVRRPAAASRFNGVVLVEWLNVTNGYDTDVLWLYQKDFLIREGYAWVGVSAQNAGLSNANTGLKVWSPKRYGTLDVTNGGAVANDGLAADVYSQAGEAVRKVAAVLGGLRPTYVIAAGQSQSASRMGPYLNGPHFRNPVYDAALLTVWNVAIRPDLTIPVIKVLSETERNTARQFPDNAMSRVWPVTGSTHSEQYSLLSRAAFLMRDLKLQAVDMCDTPARSRVEIRYVYNAAVDALVRWKKTGTPASAAPMFTYDENAVIPPPAAAPAQVEGRGGRVGGGERAGGGGRAAGGGGRGGRGGEPAEKPLVRDARGNALGGIRLAEIEAPTARESGELCGLGGTHVPFDTATLNSLYPTNATYVARVTAAANAAVKAGFQLPADAAETIARAKASIHGRQLTCGPLCADVRQFPSNPSSMLLSNQTRFLIIKDGATLVNIMDEVTLRIAEGYTLGSAPAAKKKFSDAAAGIDRYIARTRQLATRGNMAPETEKLLGDQAMTLKQKVLELAM